MPKLKISPYAAAHHAHYSAHHAHYSAHHAHYSAHHKSSHELLLCAFVKMTQISNRWRN